MEIITKNIVINGGEGSGNFGHEGRPGKVGGSGESENFEDFLNGKQKQKQEIKEYGYTHPKEFIVTCDKKDKKEQLEDFKKLKDFVNKKADFLSDAPKISSPNRIWQEYGFSDDKYTKASILKKLEENLKNENFELKKITLQKYYTPYKKGAYRNRAFVVAQDNGKEINFDINC